MLNYIRPLVPKVIKGKILEYSYKVSLNEFCGILQIKFLQCFIGSRFWETYWKNFATKVSFIVKIAFSN